MKNIALIIAGGTGTRMKSNIPKQFILVHKKPIIVYTLKAFQLHKEIDSIYVVCLKEWISKLKAYARKNKISKLKKIIPGGKCGQESIKNGIFTIAKENKGREDIVLVHDAVRPNVKPEIISDSIKVCRKHGNAISADKCTTVVLQINKQGKIVKKLNRDLIILTQTPQAFYVKDLLNAHKLAIKKGITNSTASCNLYMDLGKTLYPSLGSCTNIKLTTKDDLEIFKLYVEQNNKK